MASSWSALLQPARLWSLFKQTFSAWSGDKVPRHGAALAYYTVLSLVPLLVVIIGMIGLIFGREAAQGYIIDQIGALVGPQSAEAIKEMIQRANKPTTGIVATVVATATLLLGASGVFGQLQDSLNSIWGVQPKEGRGIWGLIKDRFISFTALLGTGFLLLVSLVLSAALSAVGKWFGGWLPAPEFVLQTLEFLISLGVIAGLFAMMFKLLPDAQVVWRDVWIGAVLTALLFAVGKFAIGLYLGKSDVGSAYGAAGSLVIVLVWIYYSAQILLFGAEFTQVYANALGSRIVPSADAQVADPKKAGGAVGGPAKTSPDQPGPHRGDPRPGHALPSRVSSAEPSPVAWGVGERGAWGASEQVMAAVLLGYSMVQLMRGFPKNVRAVHWLRTIRSRSSQRQESRSRRRA